jgi:hypothetical protein
MIAVNHDVPEPLARWAMRVAWFSVVVVLIGGIAHRFLGLPTPVALNLFYGAMAGALLALVLASIAVVRIWIKGRSGAFNAGVAVCVALGLLAWPISLARMASGLPTINDVTTDTANPPTLGVMANVRGLGASPAKYPGERFAELQRAAYPDLRTFVVDRPAEEVFDLATQAIRGRRGLGWKIVSEQPPQLRPARAGLIEANEKSMIFGFVDDIVVRVAGDEKSARVDVRSLSRYGRHDLGTNAARVRKFIRELQARLEATGTGIATRGGVRAAQAGIDGNAAVPKRPRDRELSKADARNERDRAQTNAQRGRAQRDRPRE